MKWITHEHVEVDRVACPWLKRGEACGDFMS
jgi:hypothetical protein